MIDDMICVCEKIIKNNKKWDIRNGALKMGHGK